MHWLPRVGSRSSLPLLLAASTARHRCDVAAGMMCAGVIEVERKFQPPTDLAALDSRVRAEGGNKLGEKIFKDTYYDTQACDLTRRDVWLRLREDSWEVRTACQQMCPDGPRGHEPLPIAK